MTDWNTAERERQANSAAATDKQCYETGKIHKAYGWARSPSGDWNSHQTALYNRGYNGQPTVIADLHPEQV